MTPEDQDIIARWAGSLPGAIPGVILAPGSHKTAGEALTRFCDAFETRAADVPVKRDGDHPSGLPALIVGPYANIAFQILPQGKWLGFFLDGIGGTGRGQDALGGDLSAQLARLQLPATLRLYVTHQCPHCPRITRQLLPQVRPHPLLHLAIIDAALFPEQAREDRVQAVPTLMLEDQFRWTGTIDLREVIEFAAGRDPTQLSANSLRQFLANGHAQKAAEMMGASHRIFPALIDLLSDERWSVRLAAMVTAECLAEEAPTLLQDLIDPLWERFPRCSTTVKGDLAYIMRIIDADRARSKLRLIAARETDLRVKESALEALSGMVPSTDES